MELDSLIHYFKTAPMPIFPVKYSVHAMAGPNFVPYHIEQARAGNPHALQRLREFRMYLEKQKGVKRR